MKKEYYQGNRSRLYQQMKDNSMAVVFSGKQAPLKTGDEFYPFFAERNFVYLTGIEQMNTIFLACKKDGEVKESLFILPNDELKERWTGKRFTPDQAREISGIETIDIVDHFSKVFHTNSYLYEKLYLDLGKLTAEEMDHDSDEFLKEVQKNYAYLKVETLRPILKKLRMIKQPCEIEALRKAEEITGKGIVAMMKAAKPGMYEYQLKAEYDYALTNEGVLSPGFPSIICCGDNNFCIHYYSYTGKSKDGDLVLNDVGAIWDHMICDVSRSWPINGQFSERQRILYQCAYNTSNYMFSIIKPGMLMGDVDRIIKEYTFAQLKEIGLCETFDDVYKYMWHGGSHHIGYDVHDIVDYRADLIIEPNMVFCVDVGIYVLQWGIGFRLEDNCLITEEGCENLSAAIPRSIEEIETVLAK